MRDACERQTVAGGLTVPEAPSKGFHMRSSGYTLDVDPSDGTVYVHIVRHENGTCVAFENADDATFYAAGIGSVAEAVALIDRVNAGDLIGAC